MHLCWQKLHLQIKVTSCNSTIVTAATNSGGRSISIDRLWRYLFITALKKKSMRIRYEQCYNSLVMSFWLENRTIQSIDVKEGTYFMQVAEESIANDDVVVIKGTQEGNAATVLLRGANDYMLDEMDRSLHDSFCIVKRVMESGSVVPGLYLAFDRISSQSAHGNNSDFELLFDSEHRFDSNSKEWEGIIWLSSQAKYMPINYSIIFCILSVQVLLPIQSPAVAEFSLDTDKTVF